MTTNTPIYDIAIVGYGPVGQTLATLLGRRGWQVLVLDKQSVLYPLPRACHLDHEAMRILQQMGIADQIIDAIVPAREYLLLRQDLSVLSNLPRNWQTPSGWESSYHFYQPDIEGIFDHTARSTPGVTVRQSSNVTTLVEHDSHIDLLIEGASQPARAKFVIGADGANSLVRQHAKIDREDLGFEATWVVVDVQMNPGATHPDVPDTGQILDPTLPSHMAWLGADYYRWEFMIVDGGDPVFAAQPENIWPRLNRWISEESATLLRSTTYTFRSLLANIFNNGRVLLAGDAAHLMPPFMGQGMVSGMRDAITLSWTLDMVLKGIAPQSFLDSYTACRKPHVTQYISESIRVGQLVCETDPIKAQKRDRVLEAQKESTPPFQPPLGAGFISDELGGRLAVQPRIANHGNQLLDDVLGAGFTLLSRTEENFSNLSPTTREDLEYLEVTLARITSDNSADTTGDHATLVETEDRFGTWLADVGATWVIVRPDGYVFATGAGSNQLAYAVSHLRSYITCSPAPLATSQAVINVEDKVGA